MESRLIVFAKNPVLGKVKTRLAESLGDEKALSVYKELLSITEKAVLPFLESTIIYFDELNDSIFFTVFENRIQVEGNIGWKMHNAILNAFDEGCKKVVVIGSDLPEISELIIEEAFEKLNIFDLVLGPATDGGYYLIGMNQSDTEIFQDIDWSSPRVLVQTLRKLESRNFNYCFLKKLSDIDTENDYKESVIFSH